MQTWIILIAATELLNAYWHLILKQPVLDLFACAGGFSAQRLLASNLKTGSKYPTLIPLSNTAQRLLASNLKTVAWLYCPAKRRVTAQRLLASNLKTGRSLDPLIHLDSLTILQAPVENMQ